MATVNRSGLQPQIIDVNMIPYIGNVGVITASQYDVGRMFQFVLKDGADEYIPPESAIIQMLVLKPDGKTAVVDCEIVDNIVTVFSTIQSTAISGDSTCEIQITTGDQTIASNNFILRVEKAAESFPSDFSDSDITKTIDRLMDEAKKAVAVAKEAKETIAAFIPDSGTDGQYLVKGSDGPIWQDLPKFGDMTKDGFDGDGDGIIDEAAKVRNKVVFLDYQGNKVGEFDGSNGLTLRLPFNSVSKTITFKTSDGEEIFDGSTDLTIDVTKSEHKTITFSNGSESQIFDNTTDLTVDIGGDLPEFTTDDAGKFLTVGDNGAVTLTKIEVADNLEF